MNTFDAPAFGARIAELRALRRMTLEEVALAAGFTKSHVWELETGRSRNPTVRAIWSLARALGVTPAHMLGLAPTELALHPTAMEVACLVDRALRDSDRCSQSEDPRSGAEAEGRQSGVREASASPKPLPRTIHD